jgi:hypothetical protein
VSSFVSVRFGALRSALGCSIFRPRHRTIQEIFLIIKITLKKPLENLRVELDSTPDSESNEILTDPDLGVRIMKEAGISLALPHPWN